MSTPKASVVMTVFNEAPARLDKAMESILGQTFPDFEVILVDDGSTDPDTVAALARWERVDPRVRCLRQANQGPAGASNTGLSVAKGDLIFRHDSDDWSDLRRFERQVAYMDAHPDVAVVGSTVQLYQEDGTPVFRIVFPAEPAEVAAAFQVCNPIGHGAACIRRQAVMAIGGYREELPLAPDYDFFWRLCDRWPGANLPDVLYHRVYRSSSVTATKYKDRRRIQEAIRLLAESRGRGAEMPYAQALALASERNWGQADAEAMLADELMRAGHYRLALGAYRRGLTAAGGRVKPTVRLLAKIGRLTLFAFAPRLRHRLFREPARVMLPPLKPREG